MAGEGGTPADPSGWATSLFWHRGRSGHMTHCSTRRFISRYLHLLTVSCCCWSLWNRICVCFVSYFLIFVDVVFFLLLIQYLPKTLGGKIAPGWVLLQLVDCGSFGLLLFSPPFRRLFWQWRQSAELLVSAGSRRRRWRREEVMISSFQKKNKEKKNKKAGDTKY